MSIGESDLSRFTGGNSHLPNSGIVVPGGVLTRLIHFLHPVGARHQADLDGAVVSTGEGRTRNQFGTAFIGVDVELPATTVLASVGLLHDLGITMMDVIEGDGAGFACGHGQFPGSRIKVPVLLTGEILDFLDIVSTGQQPCSDQAICVSGKGGTGNGFGASFIGVDIELPACQRAAGVGGLDDLAVTVMGIGVSYGSRFTGLDRHLTDGGIVIPQRIAGGLVHLTDVVGAGEHLHGDLTGRIGSKGRAVQKHTAVSIRVDVELPALQIFAGIGLLDDLGITGLLVGEGHRLGSVDLHLQSADGGIKGPVGMLGRLIHLLNIVGAGQQIHHNGASGIGCEGRTVNLGSQVLVGIDIEFPALQIGTGVGLLDDLTVAVVGVGDGYLGRFISVDLDSLHAVIGDPVVDVLGGFLDIVGTGLQIADGDLTVCRRRKGRTGNGVGAGRVRVNTENPSGQPLTGVGCLLDLKTAGDFLVDCIDRDGVIRGILRQRHRPFGGTAGLIAIGEHSLRDHIGAQGQFAGLGIAGGIGGTNVVGVAGLLIDSLELGTGQVGTVGVLLVDLDETGLGNIVIHIQVIPCDGLGGLGACIAHVLDGTDLRTAGVADMDNEVVLTCVGTVLGVQVVLACVDGDMHIRAIPGKDDDVTGDQILVGGAGAGVLGNTGTGLGSQRIQGRFPGIDGSQVIGAAILAHFLDLVIDGTGIHALDVGQVVTQEIGHEGGTDQTIAFKVTDLGCLAGDRAGILYGFITVGTSAGLVVSNVRENMGCVGLQAAGDVLGHIQVAVLLQPGDIEAGVCQRPENGIVIHLIGDLAHVCQGHDAVGIRLKDGAGVEIVHRLTVGVRIVRIQRIISFDGGRQLFSELGPPLLIIVTYCGRGDFRSVDLREYTQQQHENKQQRDQPLPFFVHVIIILSKVDIEKGSSPKELKP